MSINHFKCKSRRKRKTMMISQTQKQKNQSIYSTHCLHQQRTRLLCHLPVVGQRVRNLFRVIFFKMQKLVLKKIIQQHHQSKCFFLAFLMLKNTPSQTPNEENDSDPSTKTGHSVRSSPLSSPVPCWLPGDRPRKYGGKQ